MLNGMSTSPVTFGYSYTWSKLNDRVFLLTATGHYSDGDVKTLRYQVSTGAGRDYLTLSRKLSVEQMLRHILQDALAGKNAETVQIASSWTDIKRETGRITYSTRVNYSNWDTMVFSTQLLSARPSESEAQQVTLTHAAQAEQFRLLKQWKNQGH